MKLSVKAIALTTAILWGASLLLVGLVNMGSPAYGKAFLECCSSIYPGYHVAGTVSSVLVGTGYAVVDGGIGGAVFAWLYNLLAA
jgi:hypothetical protein